jgi:hypothetical protein
MGDPMLGEKKECQKMWVRGRGWPSPLDEMGGAFTIEGPLTTPFATLNLQNPPKESKFIVEYPSRCTANCCKMQSNPSLEDSWSWAVTLLSAEKKRYWC